MSKIRFIGLDVHADTIAVAVAEPEGEVRSIGIIPKSAWNDSQSHGEAGSPGQIRVCYEAGPTGYACTGN